MPYVYFGEAAGNRILRYGIGFSQVGDSYQFEGETHAIRPAGETGDLVCRTIDVLVKHMLGYDVEVTPIVDGFTQAAQVFNGGAPPGGAPNEVVTLQAYVGVRGNAIAARLKSRALPGDLEIVDIGTSFAVIRSTP